MTTVHIPATIEEATRDLDGLAELLTATEWHRAAIVAAHVRLGERHVHHGGDGSSAIKTPGEFAGLGIRGLRSHHTVSHYVNCWLIEHGGNYPARGADIKIPDKPWPPQERNAGSRATTVNIGQKIKDDPDLAQAAVEALIDGAINQLTPELNVKLSQAAERKLVEDYGPSEKPEKKPAKDPDAVDDAYWKRVRDGLMLLLDAQVKIDAGATPPTDVAILMQILLPQTDWDQAARDLIADQR